MTQARPDPATAARTLLRRVLGKRAGDFDVELTEGQGTDEFQVEATGGRVLLRGTNGVAVASALRHYLAHACGTQVTWDDPAPSLPTELPALTTATVASPWQHRYHLNYCTFGYSTAFWDWPRWEREIDWMAMHGVNLPLCLVGHEAIWLRVLEQFGIDDARARAFIGSPVFLPWRWMGCVHDHGAPVTDAWVDDQLRLAHRILQRQRSLGMTVVLPGFAGYVPAEVAGTRGSEIDWMGFVNRVLDPRDPLFREFGLALLGEQEREFGSDYHYAIDPYIEGRPPDGDPAALAATAGAIAGTLRTHDPRSVWVLQGWPFSYRADFWSRQRSEAFLGALPADRTLVLDLWAKHDPVWKSTSAFAGRPWLWCMLHSFGGRPGMHGDIDTLATEPARLAARPDGGQLVGVGTTMESLGHDPVLYEMFADVAWHGSVDSLDTWLDKYVRRRYGRLDPLLRTAWRILLTVFYLRAETPVPAASIVICRPALDDDLQPQLPVNLTGPLPTQEHTAELARAWDLLVDAAVRDGSTPGLRRDIVDVGHEVIARLAKDRFDMAVAAYRGADRDGLRAAGDGFVGCLHEIDRLAATRKQYLLGTWLAAARSRGRTALEAAALERDARRLLTCWVAPGHLLSDYAGRHWSGLVTGFYLPRWRLWLAALDGGLAGGRLDRARFEADLAAFEDNWITATQSYRTSPLADPVAVADTVRNAYRRLASANSTSSNVPSPGRNPSSDSEP